MSNRDGPIGVFDSGVGGLSILRALLRHLPSESFYYLADEAHCPYGSRRDEEIRELSETIAGYLVSVGVKIIVVACNTASTVALAHLRQRFPETPFVGIVPAVKPAATLTQSGVIGVLATPNTLHSHIYHDLLDEFACGTEVISRACHGLVEQVEAGELESPRTMALLRRYVEPMVESGADTLVLGCTHYPFLIPALRHIVGDEVTLIEPSMAIARQTERVLHRAETVRHSHGQGSLLCATTGEADGFRHSLKLLIGRDATIEQLHWHQRGIRREIRTARDAICAS